jgi:aspartyl-tRNA(Asn)/glutamyl-tRNA(Gln) amidotransferase subunit C
VSKITSDTTKKVARLANLPLTTEQEQIFTDQLSKIVDYIDQLNSVDTSSVEPTYNTTGLENILRNDEIEESLPQDEALANATNKKDGLFLTKGIFEED